MEMPVVAVLLLSAIPALLIARRSAKGWRAPVVFAAFYPAMLIWVSAFLLALFGALVWLRLIDIE